MGVAGLLFEPHSSNLVWIHYFVKCKSAEFFVMISQIVSELAKISVSVSSISWGVLGRVKVESSNFIKLILIF